MFKIFPIQDENTKNTFAAACGAAVVADAFAYGMADAEDTSLIMGFSQFDLDGDRATLYTLKEASGRNDFEAAFILGRATLEFLERCGAEECLAKKDAGDHTLIRSIGLRTETEEGFFGRIAGMFDGHCHGEEKEREK